MAALSRRHARNENEVVNAVIQSTDLYDTLNGHGRPVRRLGEITLRQFDFPAHKALAPLHRTPYNAVAEPRPMQASRARRELASGWRIEGLEVPALTPVAATLLPPWETEPRSRVAS
ncbi:MAG: hypothetical protein H6843_02450 [Rhodospirillaceae bacterium]|nr:hypothetical protein [Rhodospirillaceae bacterium]